MNIETKTIQNFASFLSKAWEHVDYIADSDESPNYRMDWVQANWEILVERPLLGHRGHLEIYAEGADWFGESSRMVDPQQLPTHCIAVAPAGRNPLFDVLNQEPLSPGQWAFEELVSFSGGYYHRCPPFDHVLVEANGVERVFMLSGVDFLLEPVAR